MEKNNELKCLLKGMLLATSTLTIVSFLGFKLPTSLLGGVSGFLLLEVVIRYK
jgi:hypothetical protein